MSKRKNSTKRQNTLPYIDPKLDPIAQRTLAEAYRVQKVTEHQEGENKSKRIEAWIKFFGNIAAVFKYALPSAGVSYGTGLLDNIAELPWKVWLPIVVLLLVLLLGWRLQVRHKNRKIAELAEQNRRLETMRDPQRTSSHLSPNGSTNARDL